MPGKRILITGGARSGKSRLALLGADALGARKLFVATAEARDAEMSERIARHQTERGPGWNTIEAPLALTQSLSEHAAAHDVMLVDCITLWISNLYLDNGPESVAPAVEELADFLVGPSNAHILLVTNEVGGGIVPDNELARGFRDTAGTANQKIAAVCTDVILACSGLPLTLKSSGIAVNPLPWEL